MLTKGNEHTHKLTVKQVSEIYGVSEYTVRDWARSSHIPAQKIGKKWYFNEMLVLNDQSMKDALKILGENAEYSHTAEYDVVLKENHLDVRIEVKSSTLFSSDGKEFWRFTNLHEVDKSDYYLLLGYGKSRKTLLKVYFIPSVELKKYYLSKCIGNKRGSFESKGISIQKEDSFMEGFNRKEIK